LCKIFGPTFYRPLKPEEIANVHFDNVKVFVGLKIIPPNLHQLRTFIKQSVKRAKTIFSILKITGSVPKVGIEEIF
jgi:hypothetical protein